MAGWALLLIGLAVLYVVWQILRIVFDSIDRWHATLRAAEQAVAAESDEAA